MTTTLAALETSHQVTVDDYHDRSALVPVLGGLQRQGDILIRPASSMLANGSMRPVPADGLPLVRGENGANTHLLLADGSVTARTVTDGSLLIAAFHVPAGAVAYVAHPEHGFMGIAPGDYWVYRQREQADVIRMVAD